MALAAARLLVAEPWVCQKDEPAMWKPRNLAMIRPSGSGKRKTQVCSSSTVQVASGWKLR